MLDSVGIKFPISSYQFLSVIWIIDRGVTEGIPFPVLSPTQEELAAEEAEAARLAAEAAQRASEAEEPAEPEAENEAEPEKAE